MKNIIDPEKKALVSSFVFLQNPVYNSINKTYLQKHKNANKPLV